MDKNSFVFYKDWHDVLIRKPDAIRFEVINAMCRYAFEGVVPDNLSPMADGLFSMIQVQMDNNREKFDTKVERIRAARSAAGKLGGAPVGNKNACKEKQNNQNQANQANQAHNENENENGNENVLQDDKSSMSNSNKLPLLSPKGEIPYEFFKAQYDSDGEYKRVADNVSANVRKGLAAAKIEVNWEKQVLYNVLQVAYNIRHGQKEWTVLWGGVGTGKTTLANAIIDFYGANGMCGRCGRVKAQDITISYTDQAKFREYCQKDVLFIDEVGKENKRAAYNAGSPMAELIDYRYDHHLTTIFTTNLTPGKMAKHFDVSTMDRINERSLILNIARDKSFREDLK